MKSLTKILTASAIGILPACAPLNKKYEINHLKGSPIQTNYGSPEETKWPSTPPTKIIHLPDGRVIIKEPKIGGRYGPIL